MFPTKRTLTGARCAPPVVLLMALLATAATGSGAQQGAPGPTAVRPPVTLKDHFEAAWARHPEAQALPARRDASQAQRRSAAAWTPEAPSLEASHSSDRLTRNTGSRELEVGLSIPLWLPGERGRSAALAEAEAAALESQAQAARLRLASAVRDAWWSALRGRVVLDLARDQLTRAHLTAEDVARRTRAGELSRADQHQAEGAVAAARAAEAQAQAQLAAAQLALLSLSGAAASEMAPTTEAEPGSAPNIATGSTRHPDLTALEDRARVADRATALADAQSRARPELTLASSSDRGAAGEQATQRLTLALRIPFGSAPQQDRQMALARAESLEAQARLVLARADLQAQVDAAHARVLAARTQLGAAERRAQLAQEARGFFDQAFRLGETDLPTRLRMEGEAAEAERQAALGRIDLAAAISAWRQALGLLPE